MITQSIFAISPVDGRYADKCQELRPIFSEFGLMRFRLLIEIRWFEMLSQQNAIPELRNLSETAKSYLENLIDNFNENDANKIKSIEKKINHDVKAIEYFLKEKFKEIPELDKNAEFIHFACTSEDINNLSYALMLKTFHHQHLLPLCQKLIGKLKALAHLYASIPMLARTHGQPASPTTVGKEFSNFAARLIKKIHELTNFEFQGKINGAVGNFNAHSVAYPEIDWLALSKKFVESLDLVWNAYTTQIEPHDFIAAFCHLLMRINMILIDLNRDIWGYISLDYFKQEMLANEVGSSTMPHKINPIDFENSEGNLGVANALLDFFAGQLPTSRWQRDLIDSTVLRNLGVAAAHTLIGYQSMMHGLNKLSINKLSIEADLNKHWEILTEALQTVMRRYGLEIPYEKLKSFSRGKILDQQAIREFVKATDLPENVKAKLYELTPFNYIGYAEVLAEKI